MSIVDTIKDRITASLEGDERRLWDAVVKKMAANVEPEFESHEEAQLAAFHVASFADALVEARREFFGPPSEGGAVTHPCAATPPNDPSMGPYASEAVDLATFPQPGPYSDCVADAFLLRTNATQEERVLMRALAKCWAERDAAYANLRAVQERCTELVSERRSLRARLKDAHDKNTELKSALAAKAPT